MKNVELMSDLICLHYIQQVGNDSEGELAQKIANSIPDSPDLDEVTTFDVLMHLEQKYLQPKESQ